MATENNWTDEEVTHLKTAWGRDVPVKIIAATLKKTEGAVSGKAMRLNLTPRDHKVVAVRNAARDAARKPVVEHDTSSVSVFRWSDDGRFRESMVDITGLTSQNCHWPLGNHKPTLFCGHAAIPGKPYCQLHYTRSLQPARTP